MVYVYIVRAKQQLSKLRQLRLTLSHNSVLYIAETVGSWDNDAQQCKMMRLQHLRHVFDLAAE